MVQLLELDAVIDHGRQQWIALRVTHCGFVVLHGCSSLHQLRFLVRHGLQMHVCLLLHDHGADLVLLTMKATAAVNAVILVRLLGRACASVEIRVVALHAHLAGVLFVVTHVRALGVLAIVHVTGRVVRTVVRVVVLLARSVVVVIESTAPRSIIDVSGALVTNAVPERSGDFHTATRVCRGVNHVA